MRISTLVGIALTLLGSVAVSAVNNSIALASEDNDRAEIIALNHNLAKSYNSKDLDSALSYYSKDPDTVFYEDDEFELKGWEALREYFRRAFASSNDIQQQLSEIAVVVNGDMAAAHYLILMSWSDKSDGQPRRLRYRYSQVLKREGNKWRIWQEHLSVPYDSTTGKAVFDAKS
jgi:ketosteroid isomerase-like protein